MVAGTEDGAERVQSLLLRPAIEDKGHGFPHPPPYLTPLTTNLPAQLAEIPAQTV